MKLKKILQEYEEIIKAHPLSDCVLYLKKDKEEIAILKTENKYEAWGMDFSKTPLASYIYKDEEEEYEVLNNVEEKDLIKYIPSIIKFTEYHIDIDD